jgi:cytochrome c-type biogenesis protein CcsB
MTSSTTYGIATFLYFGSALTYLLFIIFKRNAMSRVAFTLLACGWISNLAGFIIRWMESYSMGFGRIPLSNLYESLTFFSLAIAFIYIILEIYMDLRAVGFIVVTIAFLSMGYASLPSVSKEIEPLVPALQSNWLTIHVMTAFLGYAAFAVSFGVSILYLLKAHVHEKGTEGGFFRQLPELEMLDEINYKTVLIGFILLGLGIITGAAWANYAWGSYWSWDPKETWSLITWLIYAAFIHTRFAAGWHGRRSAVLSIVGFLSTLFTYLGVNLLLSGLHSYGGN